MKSEDVEKLIVLAREANKITGWTTNPENVDELARALENAGHVLSEEIKIIGTPLEERKQRVETLHHAWQRHALSCTACWSSQSECSIGTMLRESAVREASSPTHKMVEAVAHVDFDR